MDQVIRESETVVRAQVAASEPRWRTDPGRITLRVLEVLKGTPLSPTNEEVSGPDDPWVVWVKRQLGR